MHMYGYVGKYTSARMQWNRLRRKMTVKEKVNELLKGQLTLLSLILVSHTSFKSLGFLNLTPGINLSMHSRPCKQEKESGMDVVKTSSIISFLHSS